MNERLNIGGHQVLIEGAMSEGVPIVLVNTFEEEMATLHETIQALGPVEFLLVGLCTSDWNSELSPWPDDGFEGQAEAHLQRILTEVVPVVETRVGVGHPWYIAGYSMAGLFATWAALQNGVFKKVASVSGSLWYPGMVDYVEAHVSQAKMEAAYFSLGRKERKARNRKMAQVAAATETIVAQFQDAGIETIFEWNDGNHFHEPTLRLAKGIRYLLPS